MCVTQLNTVELASKDEHQINARRPFRPILNGDCLAICRWFFSRFLFFCYSFTQMSSSRIYGLAEFYEDKYSIVSEDVCENVTQFTQFRWNFRSSAFVFFAWNFRNISRFKIVDFVFQAFSSKRLNINSHKLSNEQPFERRTPIRLQTRILLAWILINAFATVRISLISFPSINVIAKSAVDTANVAFEHCWSLNARQLSISNECEI